MTKTAEETLIAILVEKLGGEVIVTREDFARADELEVTRFDRPATLDYKLTAARPPEILVGEIVTAEPQSIEPTKVKYVDAQGWNAAVIVEQPAPIICEAAEQCTCVCHKLGYISHGKCCGGDQ